MLSERTGNNEINVGNLYERNEGTIAELTPDPANFTDVYSQEVIDSDIEQLELHKNLSNYESVSERSRAKVQERTFMNLVERNDWFKEYDIYSLEDPQFSELIALPTSEIDDFFNHVDTILLIRNESTHGYEQAIGIDITHNPDAGKMRKKLGWKHLINKSKHATWGVSEFGETSSYEDEDGNIVKTSNPLPLRHRSGLKVPGFTTAKYFENREPDNRNGVSTKWDDMEDSKDRKMLTRKGRIIAMPRFVVGYSSDIADILTSDKPSSLNRGQYESEEAFLQAKKDYDTAEKRARWCTVIECSQQAALIHKMVDNLTAEQRDGMTQNQFIIMKYMAADIDEYFSKVFMKYVEAAAEDPEEAAARDYAQNDEVLKSVVEQSNNTYNPYINHEKIGGEEEDGE